LEQEKFSLINWKIIIKRKGMNIEEAEKWLRPVLE
jgi:hypothetical protein